MPRHLPLRPARLPAARALVFALVMSAIVGSVRSFPVSGSRFRPAHVIIIYTALCFSLRPLSRATTKLV